MFHSFLYGYVCLPEGSTTMAEIFPDRLVGQEQDQRFRGAALRLLGREQRHSQVHLKLSEDLGYWATKYVWII